MLQFCSSLFPWCPPQWRSGLPHTSGGSLRWEGPATFTVHQSACPASEGSHVVLRQSGGCLRGCPPRSPWRWSPCGRTSANFSPVSSDNLSSGGLAPSPQHTPEIVSTCSMFINNISLHLTLNFYINKEKWLILNLTVINIQYNNFAIEVSRNTSWIPWTWIYNRNIFLA